MRARVTLLTLLSLAGCASRAEPVRSLPPAASAPTPPPAPSPAAPRLLEAETALETARGTAVLNAPQGWFLLEQAPATHLGLPRGDGEIVLVDLDESDPDRAVQRAWQLVRPDFARQLQQTYEGPVRDGWDSWRAYSYRVSPSENRSVSAAVLRTGSRLLVVLHDAPSGELDRLATQIGKLSSSLLPKGSQRESFAGKTAHTLDAARLAQLDAFVERAMAQLEIPGVAIAITQGGKVVHRKGFGRREQGKPGKVTPDTRFLVASNTKALTTLLLALLVDQGKLHWDTPVVQLMPSFRLGDDATTQSVQVRHLVCACTGLPRKDLEWIYEYAEATPDVLMRSLAALQPTTEFGKSFQYSNQLAAAAGYVAGSVALPGQELGKAYDRAMQQRVFDPLGMRATTFDFARAQRAEHALPHSTDVDGKLIMSDPALNRCVIPARPAGGVWSTANDLIRYVQMELAEGVTERGKRLISAQALLERREPQVAMDEHTSYGMGLMVERGQGTPLVRHGGSLFGFKSQMLWLPEHDVGAVILSNADAGRTLLGLFQQALLEQLFDAKPHAEAELAAHVENFDRGIAEERQQLTIPPDPELLAQLATRYVHSTLGALTIRKTQAGAEIDVGEWHSAIATRRSDDGSQALVTIDPVLYASYIPGTSSDGKRQLTLNDGQHQYVFVEAP